MRIEIKSQWNDAVIFAHEQEGNTIAITVSKALAAQTVLRGANLRDANLSCADLTVIRDDIWAVLSSAPSEVPALIDALKNGRVDGSTYTGVCSCLVGTIAAARGVPFDSLEPDSSRPAERFFLCISKGDTPETNQASALAHQWASEWLVTMQADF